MTEKKGHEEAIDLDLENKSHKKEGEPVIHTMPKKFLGAGHSAASQARSTGIFILAAGAIFLIGGFGFLYYYFSRVDSTPSTPLRAGADIVSDSPGIQSPGSIQEEVIESDEGGEDIIGNIDEDDIGLAESEDIDIGYEDDIATTTEVNSTSTPRTIVPETSGSSTNLSAGSDTDGDGLTDLEELLIDSNINAEDTDADGFSDLDELKSSYNPAGGGTLIANPNIRKYTNASYRYSLYYPEAWEPKSLGGDESIMFTLGTDQFIQALAVENGEDETLEEWYMRTYEASFIRTEQLLYKAGWAGIRSIDGLTVFLYHPEREVIFILTYNSGLTGVLNHKNLFEMMVDSFSLTN